MSGYQQVNWANAGTGRPILPSAMGALHCLHIGAKAHHQARGQLDALGLTVADDFEAFFGVHGQRLFNQYMLARVSRHARLRRVHDHGGRRCTPRRSQGRRAGRARCRRRASQFHLARHFSASSMLTFHDRYQFGAVAEHHSGDRAAVGDAAGADDAPNALFSWETPLYGQENRAKCLSPLFPWLMDYSSEGPEVGDVAVVDHVQIDVGLHRDVLGICPRSSRWPRQRRTAPGTHAIHVQAGDRSWDRSRKRMPKGLSAVSAHGEDLHVGVADLLQRGHSAHRAVVNVGDDVSRRAARRRETAFSAVSRLPLRVVQVKNGHFAVLGGVKHLVQADEALLTVGGNGVGSAR